MDYFTDVKEFTGENPDVKKFVFKNDSAAVEAVLYKYGTYEKRTVLCVSTQCGCPVGCTFCGTGKKFIRNLSADEIMEQDVGSYGTYKNGWQKGSHHDYNKQNICSR